MNWETYLAFGDSITIGARTYLGYPELVGHKLSHVLNKPWNVVNHSVSGFKAIDLVRYIDLHHVALQQHKASITSILIGTNDIKEKTSFDDFTVALEQIIIKSKLLTTNKNVFIILIPEFHLGIMYPYSIEMNTTVREYNQLILKLAEKHRIRVLELTHHPDEFYDGVHLNKQGIENFSEQILRFILKDKGVSLG